jgi:hypothetical protein
MSNREQARDESSWLVVAVIVGSFLFALGCFLLALLITGET